MAASTVRGGPARLARGAAYPIGLAPHQTAAMEVRGGRERFGGRGLNPLGMLMSSAGPHIIRLTYDICYMFYNKRQLNVFFIYHGIFFNSSLFYF